MQRLRVVSLGGEVTGTGGRARTQSIQEQPSLLLPRLPAQALMPLSSWLLSGAQCAWESRAVLTHK